MRKNFIIAAVLLASAVGFAVQAQEKALAKANPIPSIVQKDGRYALMVDGAPYLMLGMQTNNSSDWPATLPQVWPAAEALHVNTVETPIYWEQFEPKPGQFDYTQIDTAWPRRARTTFTWCCSGSAHGRTAASTTCPSG